MDSVDQITFETRKKWFAVPLKVVFCLLLVHCHQMQSSSLFRLKKLGGKRAYNTATLWIFNAFKLTMPSGGNKDFN